MTNFKTKIATGVATASIFAVAVTSSAFAADVEVVNNGAKSDNTVIVENENTTVVKQANVTVAGTFVYATANSGGNKANGNTGGDVSINTGKATNDVHVSVTGGNNKATLPEGCGCPDDDTISIKRNGAKSDTFVKVENEDKTIVEQGGFTGALTEIGVESNSGDNQAKWNTGGKNKKVAVKTKKAKNKVVVEVSGGHNTLN